LIVKIKSLFEHKSQLLGGALISYISIAFNILSGLLYTPWMIRTIGDDQYALYTLAISVINMFLIDFGLSSAISKFLSSYYAKGDYEEANRFMGIVYKILFVIAGIIAIVLTVFYFFIDNVYVRLNPNDLIVFKRLFVVVSLYSVISFPFSAFNSVLMANERFIEVKLCGLLSRVLSVILIIICLVCQLGVYSLVLVHAFVNLGMIALKCRLVNTRTKQKTNLKVWDKSIANSLFSFSVWIALRGIAQRCIFTVMPTIIAMILGSKEITIFSLAATLEGYVFNFSEAINGMFMPKISKMLRKDDALEQVGSLLGKVSKFHVFTIGLIFVGFLCIGDSFVNLWIGSGYLDVYFCTLFLVFPALIDVPQQVAKTTLLACDVVKQQAIVYIIMSIINVVMAIVMLNTFGIIGAAIAVCVAYLVRTIGMNYLYKKYLSINIKKYFVETYGRWIICAFLTVICEKVLSKVINLTGVYELIVMGTIIVIAYTILYALICVKPKEIKNLIKSMK